MSDDRLLKEIAAVLGQSCLSDLHSLAMSELAFAAAQMKGGSHSVEEWNYALSYILQKTVALTDICELDQIETLLHG